MTTNLPQSEAISGLAARVQRLGEATARVLKQVRDAWNECAPALAEVLEAIETLPDRTRSALLQLGERGWYLDPEIPAAALFKLAEAFDDPTADADALLCGWVQARSNDIEDRLAKAFPHRAHLLAQAFCAHREACYALSIPVLLAQADGICQELHGVQLYKRNRNGEIALKPKIEALGVDSSDALMLAPLLKPLPIVASQRDRRPGSDLLNRHAVLHGESTNYDTLRNSCKAISLLSYAAWALSTCQPRGAMASSDLPRLRP